MLDIVQSYMDDVINNPETHGKLEILAVERLELDIASGLYEFRDYHTQKCIDFFELIPLWDHPNIMVKVLPFQAFILYNLLSIFKKGTNRRKYRFSYIEMARKNSKSMFMAQLEMYMCLLDNPEDLEITPPGRQILGCANSREQAGILFNHTKQICKLYDPDQSVTKVLTNSISIRNGSFIKVLATAPKSNDGWNCYFGVVDEYHCADTTAMLDVLKSSTSNLVNYHIAIITTAGFSKTVPCYETRNNCIDILRGTAENDTMFVMIFEPNEDDDWHNSNTWRKANPGLGVINFIENIDDLYQGAKASLTDRVNFLTKSLNIWCQSAQAWITADDWRANGNSDITIEDYKDYPCYAGLDMSSKSDFSSLSYVFLLDKETRNPLNGIVIFTYIWIPKAGIDKRKQFIQRWAEEGHVIVTKGNVTDQREIVKKAQGLKSVGIQPEVLAYDPWNCATTAVEMEEDGFELIEHSQKIGAFNRATKELEGLVLNNKATHTNNPCIEWMIGNVVLAMDMNGNVKPDKKHSEDKIDGVISITQALGAALYDYIENNNSVGMYMFN